MVDAIQSGLLRPQPGAIRPQLSEQETHAHGRHGAAGLGTPRDVLDLPARFAPGAVEEGDDDGTLGKLGRGDRNGSALEGFRGAVQSAVNSIRRDLGQVLKGLGFDSEVTNLFAKSFIEPVVAAIKEGVSFTAELSFAAFYQVTEITASSARQSTSLVARSLEISVNQETGEVSLSLASLSLEQDISVVTGGGPGGGAPPLLTLGPGPVTYPPEAAEVVFENPLDPLLNALPPVLEGPVLEGPVLEGNDSDQTETDPVARLLTDLRASLVASAFSFEAIIVIRSLSVTTNWQDQPVTNLVVDVALPLDRPEESEPVDVIA